MRHRIIVLGAGYAGAASAGYLARHLHCDDVEITVVNAEPDFVERIRLHQLAAGHQLPRHRLTDMFAGTGIRLRVARVTAVDADARTVTVADDEGTDQLGYDTLLYTLGSSVSDGGVPGVREHAFDVTSEPSARSVRERLAALGENARVLVVGGNLTAIESATEIAEARPDLRVSLVTTDQLGGWLGTSARQHMLRAFDRLGVPVHEHATVTRVGASEVVTSGGATFPTDMTVWAAGFAAHPIAAASGLAVEENGRVTVDDMMRSVSHPGVYAAGDSVLAVGGNGRALPMSCATAGFTRMRATAAIIRDLTGHEAGLTLPLAYFGNCVSLGENDGIFQMVDGTGRSKAWSLRGRSAAYYKRFVYRNTAWNMHNPTYGLPTWGRRVTAAPHRASERVTD
ncbi:FAD-dependent oxidoreductase [Spiractinospora alimapuensis]|uniref:NAD(P)/FAD-dependent oxidoreductase n=1 Tax=Spiractinospora alimapuensis TaxID=2820884 RepID=UPI001F185696|nr:FAD-dependent oxidoreductase [Spiractinospora alimapuensis]QVQ54100.1 FAD-dependent oxidoreductase [Spiractinospora alimapuensis]